MISAAEQTGISLGKAALAYEEELLGIDKAILQREMSHRLAIMTASVKQGFSDDLPMKLLRPSAGKLWKSAEKGSLFVGGPHARAAIRSMAALHVCASGGVVCAAPTGGAAGVIPGVLVTLANDLHVPEEKLLDALWAAGAIGMFHDSRSTFAAEVAGCQVEIGAAGAMAAAAVVEAAGGTPRQACDAAATVFQNVMGSVCDLIQGVVEIPCHSRNAALASQAFLCSDLVLSGYTSPIPLDETISAVDSVGRMLPEELRCTSRGGLALCPSARAMPRLDKTNSNQGGKQ
jgi:L-serine dehydratase